MLAQHVAVLTLRVVLARLGQAVNESMYRHRHASHLCLHSAVNIKLAKCHGQTTAQIKLDVISFRWQTDRAPSLQSSSMIKLSDINSYLFQFFYPVNNVLHA